MFCVLGHENVTKGVIKSKSELLHQQTTDNPCDTLFTLTSMTQYARMIYKDTKKPWQFFSVFLSVTEKMLFGLLTNCLLLKLLSVPIFLFLGLLWPREMENYAKKMFTAVKRFGDRKDHLNLMIQKSVWDKEKYEIRQKANKSGFMYSKQH